jgi:hypothetical protein
MSTEEILQIRQKSPLILQTETAKLSGQILQKSLMAILPLTVLQWHLKR